MCVLAAEGLPDQDREITLLLGEVKQVYQECGVPFDPDGRALSRDRSYFDVGRGHIRGASWLDAETLRQADKAWFTAGGEVNKEGLREIFNNAKEKFKK